jgi:hypothetical protein
MASLRSPFTRKQAAAPFRTEENGTLCSAARLAAQVQSLIGRFHPELCAQTTRVRRGKELSRDGAHHQGR